MDDLIDFEIETARGVTGCLFHVTEKPPFKSIVVAVPFQGRKVRHLAGVFYDSTMAPETFCGQPTKTMSRESADVLFNQRKDCQQCASRATRPTGKERIGL